MRAQAAHAMPDEPQTEFWLHGFAIPHSVADLARRCEAWGFDGLLLADSQNLTADIWVELTLAAQATSTLRIGPGVTNPLTRHPAVTAAAAMTLQRESGNRVSLGFGQGDSALSQIGLRPLSVRSFEQAIETLQGFLRGEPVPLSDIPESRIRWAIDDAYVKVPVHVAASGPRTVAAAARHADGVDLTVGADLSELTSKAAIARDATSQPVRIGAYLNVAVDPDPVKARELVRGSVGTFARFSEHTNRATATNSERGGNALMESYEAQHHGESRAGFAQAISDEFIDRFAIAGTADHVRSRLREVAANGIERVIIVPGSLDSDPEVVKRSCVRLAEVLSELRG
jgi:5,10-methylenetetrahydromethanopterin reductase